jgi:hypothetical protein
MNRIVALVFALGFSSAAEAAPVNLTCQVDPGPPGSSAPQPIHVTLNEAQGTATYELVGVAGPFTEQAVFTADAVTFGVFKIDRTNLAFYVSGRRGKCALLKRAF